MKLIDKLHALARDNPDIAPILLDAIDRIELAQHWRNMALTASPNVLHSPLQQRKEKDDGNT